MEESSSLPTSGWHAAVANARSTGARPVRDEAARASERSGFMSEPLPSGVKCVDRIELHLRGCGLHHHWRSLVVEAAMSKFPVSSFLEMSSDLVQTYITCFGGKSRRPLRSSSTASWSVDALAGAR